MKRYLTIALVSVYLLIPFTSCGPKKKVIDPKFDDSLYELTDHNFYKNKTTGQLFVRISMLEEVKDSGKRLVFYYKEAPAIDLKSYTKLGFGDFYSKDKDHVYTWEITSDDVKISVLDGADPATFKAFAFEWAKDTNKVYNGKNILKGLDPSQMAIICSGSEDSVMLSVDYVRDNDQLFYKSQELHIPNGMDLQKLTCVEDLFGNPFLSYNNNLYVIRNDSLVARQ